MKRNISLCESVDNDTLLQIAQLRYPEYKSFEKTFINGKFVCINKNALFRVIAKVKHKPSKGYSVLTVDCAVTPLGSLLASALWGAIIYRSFIKEVAEVFTEELERLSKN